MSATITATPRVKVIQKTALAMLVLAGCVNYIDRATLAVANPLIRHDMGLSIADMGYLLSAFLWSYAFAQLPTGAMVDRLGPRLLLTLGLSLWSLAQLLGGFVPRNFPPAPEWPATGSTRATEGSPPAYSTVPPPWAPPSPCRC